MHDFNRDAGARVVVLTLAPPSIGAPPYPRLELNGEYFAIDSAFAHFPCDRCADSLEGVGAMYPWNVPEPSTGGGDILKERAYEGARTFPVRVRAGIVEICEEAA